MAYCLKCGAYIPDGQIVCLACGYDPNEEKREQEKHCLVVLELVPLRLIVLKMV